MDAMLLQLRELSAAKGQAAPFRRDLAKRPRGTGGKIPVKDCAIREELQKLSLWKSLCRNGGACLPFAADFAGGDSQNVRPITAEILKSIRRQQVGVAAAEMVDRSMEQKEMQIARAG
jgi:hypothetical protein